MKKLLMTLIVSFALFGTMYAQFEPYYPTHWPDFNDHAHADNKGLVAYVQVNGEYANTENYQRYEVAAFVGDECRGVQILIDETELGDEYPAFQMQIYFDTPDEELTFKVYDHVDSVEYSNCTPRFFYTGEATTLYTGHWYLGVWGDPDFDEAIVLCFESDGYTKHIQGFAADYDPETNPNDHYYLIASPLANENGISPEDIEGMTEDGFDLYYFNQSGDGDGNEWITYKGAEFPMMSGVGYLYAHGTDIDLTFTGDAYEGDGKVDLVYDAAAYWKGWNLVGNPFTSEAYANRDYYALQNDKELSLVTDNAAVGAMEGIFVCAADENDTELTFTSEPASGKGSMVSLNVSRANRVLDRTVVRFGGDRVLPKFQLRATSTKLYIPMEGKDYAVVSAEGMGEMPVNFRAEKSGSYTISAKGEEVNFTYLHLIDNMTGADVDLLATPSYSFDASTTDYESRFRLLFATGSSEDGDNFGFINGAGNLSIYGIEGEATLQVMDVNGRVLSTETFSGSYEKSLNVAAGIYMLRLTNGDNVKVQKMVIR